MAIDGKTLRRRSTTLDRRCCASFRHGSGAGASCRGAAALGPSLTPPVEVRCAYRIPCEDRSNITADLDIAGVLTRGRSSALDVASAVSSPSKCILLIEGGPSMTLGRAIGHGEERGDACR